MEINYNELTSSNLVTGTFTKQINSIYLRVPPIKQEFEPTAELKNLRKFPVEKRARALSEFKSKLVRQTEAMAYLRVLLEEIFSKHEETTKEEMLKILDEVSSNYGLVPEIKSKYVKILEKAFKEKENIVKLNNSFSDKAELFELVTKTKLQHPELLRIENNPFSLVFYVSAQDIDSFERYKNKRKPKGIHNISDSLDLIQGPVTYSIIFYDSDKADRPELQNAILEHEAEHAKDRLFNGRISPESRVPLGLVCLLLDNFDKNLLILNDYKNKLKEGLNATTRQDIEQKIVLQNESLKSSTFNIKLLIERYMFQYEAFITDFARNELVAQKKEGVVTFNASEVVFKYDFSGMTPVEQRLLSIGVHRFDDLYIKIIKFRNKIELNFVKASEAFDNLVEKGKFTKEEAIALLTYTPLQFWPKEVARILEKRKKALKKTYPLNNFHLS